MPGFKYGEGDEGGYSRFGKDKKDGFVIHRFHPFAVSSGSIVHDGKVIDAKGDGCFIHAIQAMRADSVSTQNSRRHIAGGSY